MLIYKIEGYLPRPSPVIRIFCSLLNPPPFFAARSIHTFSGPLPDLVGDRKRSRVAVVSADGRGCHDNVGMGKGRGEGGYCPR